MFKWQTKTLATMPGRHEAVETYLGLLRKPDGSKSDAALLAKTARELGLSGDEVASDAELIHRLDVAGREALKLDQADEAWRRAKAETDQVVDEANRSRREHDTRCSTAVERQRLAHRARTRAQDAQGAVEKLREALYQRAQDLREGGAHE